MAAVLVVDDEPNIRRLLGSLLTAEGHTIRTAASGEAGLRAVAELEPDVMLLDLALPGASGLDVLSAVRESHPTLPVVMMSGRAPHPSGLRGRSS